MNRVEIDSYEWDKLPISNMQLEGRKVMKRASLHPLPSLQLHIVFVTIK